MCAFVSYWYIQTDTEWTLFTWNSEDNPVSEQLNQRCHKRVMHQGCSSLQFPSLAVNADRTKAHPSSKGCATCNNCVSQSHVLRRTSTSHGRSWFSDVKGYLAFFATLQRTVRDSGSHRDVNEMLVLQGCYLVMEWPYMYNLPSTTAKLRNTLRMLSNTVAPWGWLHFVAETCRNKTKYWAISRR
jgi:hypothetical protein